MARATSGGETLNENDGAEEESDEEKYYMTSFFFHSFFLRGGAGEGGSFSFPSTRKDALSGSPREERKGRKKCAKIFRNRNSSPLRAAHIRAYKTKLAREPHQRDERKKKKNETGIPSFFFLLINLYFFPQLRSFSPNRIISIYI